MCSYLIARRYSVQEVKEVLAYLMEVGRVRRELHKRRHDDDQDDQDDGHPDRNSYTHFDPRRTIGGFVSRFDDQ